MPVRQKEQEVTNETEAKVDKDEAEQTAATPTKTTKTPIPEGFISPVDFAKERTIKEGKTVPPQMIYGYIKNMKGFPVIERGEDEKPRFIVDREKAHAFLDAKATEKAEKAAAKAAAAQAEAEKAKAATESQPAS